MSRPRTVVIVGAGLRTLADSDALRERPQPGSRAAVRR